MRYLFIIDCHPIFHDAAADYAIFAFRLSPAAGCHFRQHYATPLRFQAAAIRRAPLLFSAFMIRRIISPFAAVYAAATPAAAIAIFAVSFSVSPIIALS